MGRKQEQQQLLRQHLQMPQHEMHYMCYSLAGTTA